MDDTLGKKLKKLRQSQNLSLDQVAKLVGLARNTICGYERDDREPSYETLVRFARIYKVSTDYLLGIDSESAFIVEGLGDREHKLLNDIAEYMKSKKEKNER